METLEYSYYVKKHMGQWSVSVNNPLYGQAVNSLSKEEAIEKAVNLAKTHLPAQVLIYSDQGELVEKRIFPHFSDPVRFESWTSF